MQIIVYRGTHEIGGSCVEIIKKNNRIIIDMGIPLVDASGDKFSFNEYINLSGPELVKIGILPDIKGIYYWDKEQSKIDGLLISHSHQDH
ncbi:MAG: hypothetical protein ACOCRK_01480 [bacterium]